MKAFLRTEYTNKQTTNIEEPRCLPQNALCQSTWQHHRALHTMHTRHIQAGYAHGERQPRPRMVDDLFQFLLHTLLLMLHCALSLSLHVSLSLSLSILGATKSTNAHDIWCRARQCGTRALSPNNTRIQRESHQCA